MNFLEKIRSRSNAEKRVFAFYSALFITLIIAIIWFISFSSVAGDAIQSDVQKLSPLKSLFESIKRVLFSIKFT